MFAMKSDFKSDFRDAIMATLGYAPRRSEPGKFERFGPRKSGWAKLFDDCLGGVFRDHGQNLSSHWSAN